MESDLEVEAKENLSGGETPFLLALIISLISFVLIFCSTLYENHGVFFTPLLFEHPDAFAEYLAQAFGGAWLFPLLHVGLASIFKSKRNSSSRRNIFIGWSVLIIFVTIASLNSGVTGL